MLLTRRTATPADFNETLLIKKAALGPYIEQVWGWNDQAQQQYHQSHFQPEAIAILLCDGEPAGFLETDETPGQLNIKNLLLLPVFQNRGFGTQVLQQLMQQAEAVGQEVYLEVLKVNTQALRLYQKLGFVVRDTTELKVRMVYSSSYEIR